MYPSDLKYTKEHEWARIDKDVVTVGITDYAQEELGDIVYVELPKEGTDLGQMKEFGVVESVKTVSQLYSPVNGRVIETNKTLADNAGLINTNPYDDGWIAKIKLNNKKEIDELMTSEQYQRYLEAI